MGFDDFFNEETKEKVGEGFGKAADFFGTAFGKISSSVQETYSKTSRTMTIYSKLNHWETISEKDRDFIYQEKGDDFLEKVRSRLKKKKDEDIQASIQEDDRSSQLAVSSDFHLFYLKGDSMAYLFSSLQAFEADFGGLRLLPESFRDPGSIVFPTAQDLPDGQVKSIRFILTMEGQQRILEQLRFPIKAEGNRYQEEIDLLIKNGRLFQKILDQAGDPAGEKQLLDKHESEILAEAREKNYLKPEE